MSLQGKSLICTQDWDLHEINQILQTALEMKRDPTNPKWGNLFQHKNFLMLFYSPSVRTHLSFVAAATELGGHAQYIDPKMVKFKSNRSAGETIEDAAKVMSGFMAGIGIRIMEGAVSSYGEGNELIREYAKYADVPVINMADDVCHPCQAMADIMGWAEAFSTGQGKVDLSVLKGKKLLLTWGHGSLARSWNSPQASLLLASRLGMDITISRPDGYDMDPNIHKQVTENCVGNDSKLEVVNSCDSGYEDAHVVYSRHWVSPGAYKNCVFNKQDEIEKALRYPDWITTEEKMKRTKNAIFTHPMPIDRGSEVEDSVASGKQSVIYNVAKNRLHVQKAVFAYTMGNYTGEVE